MFLVLLCLVQAGPSALDTRLPWLFGRLSLNSAQNLILLPLRQPAPDGMRFISVLPEGLRTWHVVARGLWLKAATSQLSP